MKITSSGFIILDAGAAESAIRPDLRKLLIALFGCSDNASDETILAAGRAFARKFSKTSLASISGRLDDLSARFNRLYPPSASDLAVASQLGLDPQEIRGYRREAVQNL